MPYKIMNKISKGKFSNISRVKHRVSMGGHSVPEEKIISRYHRSILNLWPAIQHTNRAYIFDNSSIEHAWFCDITDAKTIKLQQKSIPQWFFQAVIEKLGVLE